MAETRRCPQCEDDGYIDLYDVEGFPNGAANCPDLDAPWHRPFNYTGILDAPPSPRTDQTKEDR